MTCYQFENHSRNSGRNVKAAIFNTADYMRIAFGLSSPVLAYIPFELSVTMVESRDNARLTFPIWNMRCIYTNARQLAERVVKVAQLFGKTDVEQKIKALLPGTEEQRFEDSVMPPAPPVEVPGISHNQQGAEGESDPVRELSQKNKTVVTGMLRRVNNVKGVEDVQRYALRLYEEGGMTVDDYNELSQLMEAKRVSLTAGDRPTP
jgi:hypothetical protein